MDTKCAPATGCPNCEALPARPDGPGVLHLWFPLGHTLRKVRVALAGSGWVFEASGDQGVRVRLGEERLGRLFPLLLGALTSTELEATRALYKAGGGDPNVDDLPRVQPLKRLATLVESVWLLDMLAEGRLTTHFQPIVRAAAPAEVFAHECLLRGVDAAGALIPPKRILEAAADANLLFQLDAAARRTAIRSATAHDMRSKVFINFTPTAVYDPAFCLRSTVAAVRESGIPNEDVVFEVIESEKTVDVEHLRGILDYYRAHGFRVALDDVGAGYSSLNLIHQLRPDYIKLDMELVRGVDGDPYKALVARKLLEIAGELGVETIAEGVETPAELGWLREHGATYAQGYLIGRPQPDPAGSLTAA